MDVDEDESALCPLAKCTESASGDVRLFYRHAGSTFCVLFEAD